VEELDFVWIAAGASAAMLFPIVALIVHGRRERRRQRKAGTRRTDKIRLDRADP
jgi:heme exporter protein D